MKTKVLTFGNEKVTDSKLNRDFVWIFIKAQVENYPSKEMPEIFDWNLLMPVVGRINSVFPMKGKKFEEIREKLNYCVVTYNIGGVWKHLVDFSLEYVDAIEKPLFVSS